MVRLGVVHVGRNTFGVAETISSRCCACGCMSVYSLSASDTVFDKQLR